MPPSPGGANALPRTKIPKPSVPMKNFNWQKIPNNKIPSTVFMEIEFGKEENLLDYSEIEGLFAQKVVEKKKLGMHLVPLTASPAHSASCVQTRRLRCRLSAWWTHAGRRTLVRACCCVYSLVRVMMLMSLVQASS